MRCVRGAVYRRTAAHSRSFAPMEYFRRALRSPALSRPLTISACAAVLELLASAAAGQVPASSLLQIDVKDHTIYVLDGDRALWATSPAKLTRQPPKTFETWVGLGDIVSVNGSPAKGTVFESSMTITSSPSVTPGQAIGDSPRGGLYQWNLDLLQPNGTSLGLIQISGLSGGPPPPGAPTAVARANYDVVGGTGVFAGVRGFYQANIDTITPVRTTSAVEDPAYRRVNGGGILHLLLYLIPATPPQVIALYHSDSTPVTLIRPARLGETLLARATGLGPVSPGVEPGAVFPADQSGTVSAPITVMVNGQPADVLKAVGWPGTSDSYLVQFRLPAGISAGAGTIRLGVAWMSGPATAIVLRDSN